MSVLQNLSKYFKSQLDKTAVFTSFPLSLLLFGLETLLDVQFSCPCGRFWHKELPSLMFAGPPCFTFMLMFLLTRPLKNINIRCFQGCVCATCQNKKKRCNTFCLRLKSFLHCLIPPLVWVVLFFYDVAYSFLVCHTVKKKKKVLLAAKICWCMIYS
uniref:Uncharacterized protein n=1 Tax=Sinocyclocheilus grahami TaxID=75366 RepID=A0A672K814_SINGR